MICAQTRVPGVLVSQVARRYDANANLVFTWLRDPRFRPDEGVVEDAAAEDHAVFLPVEVIREAREVGGDASAPAPAAEGLIELELASGHRMRVMGCYDPEALARLIRGLSA